MFDSAAVLIYSLVRSVINLRIGLVLSGEDKGEVPVLQELSGHPVEITEAKSKRTVQLRERSAFRRE